MEIGISLEIDASIDFKSNDIINMSNDLENHFRNKDYGTDVKEIYIGLICIESKLGIENLFKVRKPKYTDFKKSINRLTGEEMIIQKNFCYDVKLENDILESFKQSNQKEGQKILAFELIHSLKNLEFLSKKVQDFERMQFEKDFIGFFEKRNLI
jgi:hypothetical protein